jgi:endonuclease/exonuclease/phosphatase family metal-dependent hydrolase
MSTIPIRARLLVACLLCLALLPARAAAQAEPPALRAAPDSLRIVTLNVADGVCTTAFKAEGRNRWTALARLVAALKPDVLLLQEAGDNSGNGSGSGVDGVAGLEAALQLFVSGGPDPFHAGAPPVTAFVQAYDPDVLLPHVFVSSRTDGYNRNALLSRHPFADLNGDGKALQSDMPQLLPVGFAAGGDGGLRGFQIAEIDLPDGRWAGDLVVGNSHLKAGTGAPQHEERVRAARNIAYYIEHLLNGAGTGLPDPHAAVADAPPAQAVLGAATLVVTGGDWNEDEAQNGEVKGPAAWIGHAAVADADGGTDGPDRDGSDLCVADARDPWTGSAATQFGTTRDYLAYQDAIAGAARAFVFDTATLPADGAATPLELLGFTGGWAGLSAVASDHRPVVLDLLPPPADCRDDATDLGHGKPGAGCLVPRFTVCGALAAGGAATFRLEQAAPGVRAWLLASASAPPPLRGPGLVPCPPRPLAGRFTGWDGALEWSFVPAARGPALLYAQWLVLDPEAEGGFSLSNALAIEQSP